MTLRFDEAEPFSVSRQHPDISQQVVRKIDRLGPLEMRVARHRPIKVGFGYLDQRRY